MAHHPRVKVCGLTRGADASLAARLGAHAIGFICTPGLSRSVAPASIPALTARADAEPVLVFRSPSVEEVDAAVRDSGVRTIQLHRTGPEVVAALHRRYRVVVAHEVLVPGTVDAPTLIDSGAGGTGHSFDWSRLAPAAPEFTWIAGGIRPENITTLLAWRPWGIDVSSGVESAPGVKDAARLEALFGALIG